MTFEIRSKEMVNKDGNISCYYELQPRKVITMNSRSIHGPSPRSNEKSGQPGDHRVFKLTFQRKRKRNTLSISDGNVLVGNHTTERKDEEEKTQSAEPEKSSSVPKSSRESTQEVARQLIALSEGKYW